MVAVKTIGITFPSKMELIVNRLIQDGERVRVEYAGKRLQENPKVAKFVQELGLKKPRVLVGVNGRGNSAVAGITVKDGDKTVLQAAGGVDYTFGERPLIQLRGRVAEGQGARLNMVADLNKPVNPENVAVNMANRGGKLDVTVDSDMLRGNLTADMSSREMRIPQVKRTYDRMMEMAGELINGNKGVKSATESISKKLNRIRKPFAFGPAENVVPEGKVVDAERIVKNAAKGEVACAEHLDSEEFDKAKQFAADLRKQGDRLKEERKVAEEMKRKQMLTDEDCIFIADRAKKLGIRSDDPEILKDPEIIKRFGL